MELICINNEYFDPYYILQVTPDDIDEKITSNFKRMAKRYHPDKAPKNKQKDYRRKFEIISESYKYILNKRNTLHKSHKTLKNSSQNTKINVATTDEKAPIPKKFGYGEHSKIRSVEEYDDFKQKIINQFEKKKFSNKEFNIMFEYIKEQELDSCNESDGNSDTESTGKVKDEDKKDKQVGLLHKTSDGFYGYNTTNLSNCALVSSFNGLLIAEDDLGESGIGYWNENYGDYKHSYSKKVNPDNIVKVPIQFKREYKARQSAPTRDYNELLKERKIKNTNKISIKEAQEELYNIAKKELLEKQHKDKRLVEKYKSLYDKETFEMALDGRLEKSPELLQLLDSHFKVKRIE